MSASYTTTAAPILNCLASSVHNDGPHLADSQMLRNGPTR